MKTNAKGFFLTIDSFLSLTVVLALVVLSFFFLSKISISSWNFVDLKNVASDELSILEKSGTIETALKQSSSENIVSFLNKAPQNYCFELTVFSANLSQINLHALKPGCSKNPSRVSSVERAIAINTDGVSSFFLARLEGWYK